VPILFIHGSWDDHHSWLAVAEKLAQKSRNPLVLYDRRGHSASTNVSGQGHISGDVADAARLIRKLGLGPVHVVGHSYGASVAIALANEHPELVASLFVYEPPVFGILKRNGDYEEALMTTKNAMQKAKGLLENGDIEQGTIYFVENAAFGRGSWESIFDERARAAMTANADTWVDQSRDPERLSIDVAKLNGFNKPITLAYGDKTLPVYSDVAIEVHKTVPAVRLVVCHGAGHGGPISAPEQVAKFIDAHLHLDKSEVKD
jgi:esterase